MSFALNKSVNPPTAFIAWRSELRDRFDPEIVLFRRKIREFKYPVAKMRDFFCEPPQYGAGERGLERECEGQARYIRITDIDEYGVLTEGLGATAAAVDPRYILEENDLLIARSGTVGKSYIHKREHSAATCFFAGYLIRFRFRAEKVLPGYVFAFTQLPYYKEWVQAIQRVAVQPNINAQEYSNLEIPAPPISVQQKVISLLETAYGAKRQRDESARKLLIGIDDILLDELGIPRKSEPPNTLESRIFRRSLSNVSGGRLDPIGNQERRRLLEEAIHSARYPVVDLRKLVGTSKTVVAEIPEDQSYVGLENIDGGNGEFVATSDKEDVGTAIQFTSGQILFPKLRPYLNKTHLATFSGICSTEFHVFDAHGADAEFLTNFLRSRSIVGITTLLMTGNTHPRLQTNDIERLPIPVPPSDVQSKICKQINIIRNKARRLRKQARADLEKAKRDIEALLLGKETTK